jgi:hypothetical protein
MIDFDLALCNGRLKEGRPSFLKKRSKRLSFAGGASPDRPGPANESFLVLFFKKELLASLQ